MSLRALNESRCFVPLLVHKYYIEHLSNSSYRFIEENYIMIIIVIELSPSPRLWYGQAYVIDNEHRCILLMAFFFVINIFFISFNTQHNIHSKQNNRHILNTPKVQSKGRERGREKEKTKQIIPLYSHVR